MSRDTWNVGWILRDADLCVSQRINNFFQFQKVQCNVMPSYGTRLVRGILKLLSRLI